MRKKIMLFSLLFVLGCFVVFIANATNIFTAKKNVDVNANEYNATNGTGTDSETEERPDYESEEKLDYEDDEYVVTSRERTYKSEDEHKKFRKKLREDQESRPKTDDNILIYEDCDYELENAIEDAMMQMEYPKEVPYPRVNQFDVLISSYPNDSIYCEISTDIGKVSKRKIDLQKEKLMTYYLPDHFDDYMVDVIWFKFYGEYSKLIKEHKIYILYDEKSKKVKMAEQKVE